MKHPEFAKRFRKAVKMAGIDDTQKHLSKLLGVSEVMIWSYKNGEKLPRMSKAIHMADTFGVSVQWLLQGGPMEVKEPHATYEAKSLNKPTLDILNLLKNLSDAECKQALQILKSHFKNN